MWNAVLVAVGLALLTVGGESLIRGALAAARRLRISPLLAGLVIVGFGTSAPELVVSLDAVLSHRPAIAMGNVVGSNISNIMLILGLCAIITPLTVEPKSLRRDGYSGIAACLLFIALAGTTELGRTDGLILLAALCLYLIFAYRTERRPDSPSAAVHIAEAEEISGLPISLSMVYIYLLGGMAILIVGARILLTGAVGIAENFGVPDAVIGLTLVAVGTSLPELSVSILAALRKHADVAVGNILGSNIFNLLAILGVSALVKPLPVSERIMQFDEWVMLGAAAALMVLLYSGMRLQRWEGALLLSAYIAYIALSFTRFMS
jgi:cation:H+ antiporter